MKKLSVEEIKKIEFEILSKVAEFCDKHGLFYCLAYGTLIGAVRHKGFIPWDDDVDIVMPRKDYDYLIENFNKESEETGCYASVPGKANHSFLKIGKLGTLKYEPEYGKNGGYIDIDVFPIDGLPEDEGEYQRWYNKLRKLYTAYFYSKAKFKVLGLREKIKIFVKKCLWGCYFNKNKFLKRAKVEHEKYPFESSKYVGMLECCWISNKDRMPKEWYLERIKLEFEGKQFYAPKYYHEILTKLYGDYMTPPPEERRVAEHGITAYIIE